MKIKEKESQKTKVCAEMSDLRRSTQIGNFWALEQEGLETYCENSQWDSGQILGKYLAIWHLWGSRIDLKRMITS